MSGHPFADLLGHPMPELPWAPISKAHVLWGDDEAEGDDESQEPPTPAPAPRPPGRPRKQACGDAARERRRAQWRAAARRRVDRERAQAAGGVDIDRIHHQPTTPKGQQ